jgi:hypothetical protein
MLLDIALNQAEGNTLLNKPCKHLVSIFGSELPFMKEAMIDTSWSRSGSSTISTSDSG